MPCLPQTRASNQLASVAADWVRAWASLELACDTLELALFVWLRRGHLRSMAAEARRSSSAGLVAAAAVVVALLALAPGASRAERFVVGDAARWTWGYNYTDWVVKKGPFFQNDTLGTEQGAPTSPQLHFCGVCQPASFFSPHISDRSPLLQCSCTTRRTRRCTRTACT